jgi:hypothetical protein
MIRLILLLLITPLISVFANNKSNFVMFNYNIKSTGDHFSDSQCNKFFNHPHYYDIINDKVVYLKNPSPNGVTYLNYKRLMVTYIGKNSRLFYGTSKVRLNKKLLLKDNVSFLLNTNTRTIRGSFYIPQYCAGNFIGIQQKLNSWRHQD